MVSVRQVLEGWNGLREMPTVIEAIEKATEGDVAASMGSYRTALGTYGSEARTLGQKT